MPPYLALHTYLTLLSQRHDSGLNGRERGADIIVLSALVQLVVPRGHCLTVARAPILVEELELYGEQGSWWSEQTRKAWQRQRNFRIRA